MAQITFSDLPSTTTPLSAANLNQITIHILSILGLDVDTYNPSTNYVIDDFVVYQKELWRCTTATTGTWNEANWVRDSILVNND